MEKTIKRLFFDNYIFIKNMEDFKKRQSKQLESNSEHQNPLTTIIQYLI